MIRVVYDSQIFLAQRYGGISRYFVEIAKRIDGTRSFETTILAGIHRNELLGRSTTKIVGVRRPSSEGGRAARILSEILGASYCQFRRPDIVHETYFSRRTIAPRGVPVVVTVYDMIHERYPQLYPNWRTIVARKRAAVTRASLVICISEQTRQDLLSAIPLPAEKVVTVHLGVESPSQACAETSWQNCRPYLLYVGDRFGYKNFPALLRAYSNSELLRDACMLVAFGGGHFTAAEVELIVRLGLRVGTEVRQVSGDDLSLSRHYSGALALVYPSLYEGFGLPPLEAMRERCPVVCSDAGSLPEVVGNAAIFFDPADCDSTRIAMERIVESGELRESLIRRGLQQVSQFSWERCAERTSTLYEALLCR